MKKDYFAVLLRSENTVFTFKELMLIWRESDLDLVKNRIYRYVKAGKLHKIRKGIYAKDKNYDPMELANKIYIPSYISLETILSREGVIFQHYDRIFAVSYLSREITCDGRTYSFHKIKHKIMTNSRGVEKKKNYFTASKERAFLDTIYLHKNYYFDNLSKINWKRCFNLVSIYESKAMKKRLYLYQKAAKNA